MSAIAVNRADKFEFGLIAMKPGEPVVAVKVTRLLKLVTLIDCFLFLFITKSAECPKGIENFRCYPNAVGQGRTYKQQA